MVTKKSNFPGRNSKLDFSFSKFQNHVEIFCLQVSSMARELYRDLKTREQTSRMSTVSGYQKNGKNFKNIIFCLVIFKFNFYFLTRTNFYFLLFPFNFTGFLGF
uniref:Uncharacterized protein n=1 Tax=Cacopsylla melanoneura TaxID=428564 RepID=A0A8D8UU82_9HEMI